MDGFSPSGGQTDLHIVEFYKPKPVPINCMSYNPKVAKIALARDDGTIEIWNMEFKPVLELTISKTLSNSIQGLAWYHKRLFSIGTNGKVAEWDILTGEVVKYKFGTSQILWCVDINPAGTDLVTGSDEGYINIFDISENNLEYKKVYTREANRILCCRYNYNGVFLVAGLVGYIVMWNTITCTAIRKIPIRTSRVNNKTTLENEIVWSLQVLQDLTIVVGDSSGYLTVIDGETGAYLEHFKVMDADILSVAVTRNEEFLVCAGIDPTMRIYKKISKYQNDIKVTRWVLFLKRTVHYHDVKTIVLIGNRLFSAGASGYLIECCIEKTNKIHNCFGPFLNEPCNISEKSRMLLLRYTHHIELWRLGALLPKESKTHSKAYNKENSSTNTKFETLPRKLLQMNSFEAGYITCAAISNQGDLLAYATNSVIRLYEIKTNILSGKNPIVNNDDITINLKLIEDLPDNFEVSSKILFMNSSKYILLVDKETQEIRIFSIINSPNNNGFVVDFVDIIETKNYVHGAIAMATLSKDDKYLGLVSLGRSTHIWSISDKGTFQHVSSLPRYVAPVTAIQIDTNNTLSAIIAYSDGKIVEYNIADMKFLCSDYDTYSDKSDFHPITRIMLDTKNTDVLIMQNDLCLFSLKKEPREYPSNRRMYPNISCLKLQFSRTLQHLVYSAWLNTNEMVVVRVRPTALIDQIETGALMRQRFRAN